MNRKPICWDDLAAKHDPDSLPFWRYYQEQRQAEERKPVTRRAVAWLMGIGR